MQLKSISEGLMLKINTFSALEDTSGTKYTETCHNNCEAFYFIE